MSFRAVSVTTVAFAVIPYSPERVGWVVRNNSATVCFLSSDPTLVATQGFFLNQNDGLVFKKRDGDDTAAPLYAIVNAGSADLRIQESFTKDGVLP